MRSAPSCSLPVCSDLLAIIPKRKIGGMEDDMRFRVACFAFSLLGGCSTGTPHVDSLASRDVPCLHHQVYDLGSSFRDALGVCGTPKPDLTGSGGLQQAALDEKIPFTIRPQADASLKQAQAEKVTGSLIPHANAGAGYAPQNGILPTTITSSGY